MHTDKYGLKAFMAFVFLLAGLWQIWMAAGHGGGTLIGIVIASLGLSYLWTDRKK